MARARKWHDTSQLLKICSNSQVAVALCKDLMKNSVSDVLDLSAKLQVSCTLEVVLFSLINWPFFEHGGSVSTVREKGISKVICQMSYGNYFYLED